MPRLACLFVPLFPLAARLRSEPELRDEVTVILQGNGNAARVVAATRRARKAGIRSGMSLAQARSLLPKMIVRPRDPCCECAAQDALLEIAESFSPRFENSGEGVVYLELTGLERHFPGATPEEDLGHALTVATGKAALPAWVGIASSKLAARVAAELPTSPTIVPAGQEASFLAPLPLCRLAAEAKTLETLQRWGIRSIGAFARLSKNEVVSRLGEPGQDLHEKARGMDCRPLVSYQPPPDFHEGMELEWPLVAVEPFLFVARAALERLCRRLENRGLACSRLEIDLRLEPDGHHHRSLQLPAPTREVKTLLTLVRLDLEATPPGAPVTGFTLTAHPDRPREAQLSLFGPAAPSPDKLATTLARLFALLGSQGVGSPRTVDGHRPERFALVEYSPPPPPKVRTEPRQGRGLLAVRTLRPAVPLEVVTDSSSEQEPQSESAASPREILSLTAEGSLKRPQIQGRVKVASGPWTLEEEWWSETPVERDYWDIELSDGGTYRVFRQRRTGEWFADGIYD
jgi:protein ImuB